MTRKGTWRTVPRENANGRLRNARDFLQTARDQVTLLGAGRNGNPAMTSALMAVIAYADALSIHFGGIGNVQDHGQSADTLKHAMGARAEQKQLQRLSRMLAQKNEIQYTHRETTRAEAEAFLEQAERFAAWAEDEAVTAGIG